MTEVLSELLLFPTVIFTGALALAGLYWLFVIVGAVDTEFLDGVFDGAAEGAAEGVADAIAEGAAEAAAEGAAEAAAEAAAEGAAEAAAEGAAEGASEGAAEGAMGAKAWFADVLSALMPTNVPATFSLSVLVLWAWVVCFLGMHYGMRLLLPLGVPLWALSLGVLPLVMLGGGALTAWTVRPFGRFMHVHTADEKHALIGKVASVATGTVSEKYGQASLEDGGAGFLLAVRYEGGDAIQKGDKVLLVDYDQARDVFTIEPLDRDLLGLRAAPSSDRDPDSSGPQRGRVKG